MLSTDPSITSLAIIQLVLEIYGIQVIMVFFSLSLYLPLSIYLSFYLAVLGIRVIMVFFPSPLVLSLSISPYI